MAFPTLGIIDSFTRANEDPVANGWLGPIFTGEPQLKVVSNQLLPNTAGAEGNSYWNTSMGPDIEAYITLTSALAASARVIFYFRCTVGASVNGYRVQFRNLAGDHLILIDKMTANVNSQLGANIDPADTFASGDSFGAEMIGDTITAYYKPAAGAWTNMGSRTDTTYTGAGFSGISLVGSAVTADNFGGGTISTAARPQITALGAIGL